MEKRYDFTRVEKEMQALWEREDVYRFDPKAEGEIYSIDTPPPTVSGRLHVGHLFSFTQAEIIARFHRMQGRNVLYPFGFDDNGLPTERLVEREEGVRANDLPRSEFIAKCRQATKRYEDDFKDFWKSLGFSVDWSLEYRTISSEVRKISQERFLELARKGKAYTKDSPVLWCVECQTSIAQAELDATDTAGEFHYLTFTAADSPLTVATTRPELLYGCVCLFVHPDDERYQSYIGQSANVPLYDYPIPIFADEKVGVDKGTGVVMCATFGDATDVEWYNERGLPYRRVITPNGRIAEDVPHIGGMDVFSARGAIVRLLNERGLLLQSETITHAVGTHERCGHPIEIIPSRQWYIDILSERERFLQAADEINWYPANMKNRYTAWVENLKWDWCISRQRYFGVPFPVWYCKECGKPAYAASGQLPVNPLETAYEGVCECGCAEWVPETAVMDTWATSSLTPQINERHGLSLTPMSMRTHAHEIIRTWTFYTIVRSLYHTGTIPWKDLMICGFVLAKKGEKISKSKSNDALEPQNLIATHSADVLRYWTAGAKLGTDTFFAVDDLAVPKRFVTKLWNSVRFALSHLQDVDLANPPNVFLPVDRWIMERVRETTATAAKLLNDYEIGPARHAVDELFWKDFCDNYIEIVKERLYQPDVHGKEARASGQHALYYALLNILKMYSIYVPHITEYVYQGFFRQYEREPSIHLTEWPRPAQVDDELLSFGESLKDVLFEMRKYKSEHNLSIRTEMDVLTIRAESRFMEWFRDTEPDLRACSRAGSIAYQLKNID